MANGPSPSGNVDNWKPDALEGAALAARGLRTKETVATQKERPLVCVSHREPFALRRHGETERLERTTGGLVTALDSALRELGGTWIASGERDRRSAAPADAAGLSYAIEQVGLNAREMDGYYSGFSNQVLWPLFHYFIGRVCFHSEEWKQYVSVNRRFAQTLAQNLRGGRGGTLAWVHDYQLMLVPRMVREARPDATLGFFLHIPFPATEVFRILPTARTLLDGVLGADLVGFHTRSYREAFLDAARRLLGAAVDRHGVVEHRGRRTRTVVLPIGIDVKKQEALAVHPRTLARAQRLRSKVTGDQLVLGVDRLDYSKGIPERLTGFERLLERFPEHRGRVTLMQIAVPSRTRVKEYRHLKRTTDEMVGDINGRYGDALWTPVRYMTRGVSAEELAAFYRAADVALVTPLRDGLNLVAKEYVATRVDYDGALVLSELAGAAEEMPDAFLVNPFGPDQLCEGLHEALTASRAERERRMRAMSKAVRANDVNDWARSFVEQLAAVR